MKLAIVSTHPIQYNAPFFRLLQARGRLTIRVFYTWGETVLKDKYDPGFKRTVSWDIPLLEGYDYEFPVNSSSDKGSHHFRGIINPGLIDKLESFGPDALLVYGWSFHSHLRVLRHFKGRRLVIARGDSTLLDPVPWYKRLARSFFLRWVYRHADYALYAGKNNYDYYRAMGMKESQLIYGPHAVDNDRFSSGDGYAAEAYVLREKLGIPTEGIVFLFAGKLEEKKAPDLLLQAFSNIDPQKKIWLVIVGNGVLEQQLKEQYGNNAAIRFLDFQNQSDMPVIYRLADVFVLPSRGPGETWGLAVNEAMASCRAVLVSDRCGCAADLIVPGVNGYIVKAGDPDDLQRKLQLLAADKTTIQQMGRASRNRIAGYSYERSADSLEKLLNSIHATDDRRLG